MKIIDDLLDIVIRTILYIMVVIICYPILIITARLDSIIAYLITMLVLLIVNFIYEQFKEKYKF